MKRLCALVLAALSVAGCGGDVAEDRPQPPWPSSGCPPSHEMVDGRCTVREVYVPGGTFVMGRGLCPAAGILDDPAVFDDCPLADAPHEVSVAPFWVDATLFTFHDLSYQSGPGCVSGDLTCADPGDYLPVGIPPQGALPEHSGVPSEIDAACAAFGKRGLTEAEWEYIATWAGTRTHPWGDREPTCNDGNIDAESCPPRNVVDGLPEISKVASYPPSPEGIYDLIGNVWEVLLPSPEAYTSEYTSLPRVLDVPGEACEPGPPKGALVCKDIVYKVSMVPVRGGDAFAQPAELQGAYRGVLNPYDKYPAGQTGFRCARSAE